MAAKEQRGLRDAISSRLCIRAEAAHIISLPPQLETDECLSDVKQRINPAPGSRGPSRRRRRPPSPSRTEPAPVGTAEFHPHITEHANQKQAGLCVYVRPEGKVRTQTRALPLSSAKRGRVRKHTTQLVAPAASDAHPPPPAHKRLQEGFMLTCRRHPVVLCHSTGLCVPGKRHTTAGSSPQSGNNTNAECWRGWKRHQD